MLYKAKNVKGRDFMHEGLGRVSVSQSLSCVACLMKGLGLTNTHVRCIFSAVRAAKLSTQHNVFLTCCNFVVASHACLVVLIVHG